MSRCSYDKKSTKNDAPDESKNIEYSAEHDQPRMVRTRTRALIAPIMATSA